MRCLLRRMPDVFKSQKALPGAEYTDRCKGCKSFYMCCTERGHRFCFKCEEFPCRRLKDFARRWKKYGQDFLQNQEDLRQLGQEGFLQKWNRLAQEAEES